MPKKFKTITESQAIKRIKDVCKLNLESTDILDQLVQDSFAGKNAAAGPNITLHRRHAEAVVSALRNIAEAATLKVSLD